MRRCSRGLRAALVSTTLLHRWTSSRHLQVKSPPFQLRPPSPATAVMRTTDNPNCCSSDGSPCRDFPATFLQFSFILVEFREAALKVDKRGRTQQLGVFNSESGFLLSLSCFISKKRPFFCSCSDLYISVNQTTNSSFVIYHQLTFTDAAKRVK